MHEFVKLFHALDGWTSHAAKVAALRRYLTAARGRDLTSAACYLRRAASRGDRSG